MVGMDPRHKAEGDGLLVAQTKTGRRNPQGQPPACRVYPRLRRRGARLLRRAVDHIGDHFRLRHEDRMLAATLVTVALKRFAICCSIFWSKALSSLAITARADDQCHGSGTRARHGIGQIGTVSQIMNGGLITDRGGHATETPGTKKNGRPGCSAGPPACF